MAVDLHLHSTASDGSESPSGVVALAAAAGLGAIALTDHDNLDGVAEAREAAAVHGIEVVAGTELSVVWESSGAVHLLVYFLEPGPGPLQDRLEWLRRARSTRNERIAERLRGLGVDLSYDEVVAEAGGGVVGRPHFAAVLAAKGHVSDIADAFDRYLAAGRPAYVDRERLDAVEAIRLARASGAVPVIAHPHTIGISADEYRSAFRRLTGEGLGGIEAHYAEYEPAMRAHLAELCRDLGVVATGGSDFHGSYKPGLSVGVGRGDLEVPDSVLDELRARQRHG